MVLNGAAFGLNRTRADGARCRVDDGAAPRGEDTGDGDSGGEVGVLFVEASTEVGMYNMSGRVM